MFVPVWVFNGDRGHDGDHSIVNVREVVSIIATEWKGGYSDLRAQIHLTDGRVLNVSVRGGQHSSDHFERGQWYTEFFRQFEDAATGIPDNPWKRWAEELHEGHDKNTQ
ncbi:hypothetical protein [Pseudarthrobacter sp. PS3-L1]|uniref:hypothetical protein n=1 Tax=Pseudarthrobacter sp. PS3-L1 TaxID=3046207 RepID=UPI0024BB2338|nr:hypothetical protein [Pseudarthrobacter sp. PS3-L1]MDJ0322095.1 hypothetical protein [Pseudarthrobacter sp. PS3-L1]